MSIFNQAGQTVGQQTNVGSTYTIEQINKMLRFALEQTHRLVPDKRRIQAETGNIIRATWQMIDGYD